MKFKDHYILDVYSAYRDKLDVPDLMAIEDVLNRFTSTRWKQLLFMRFWGNATLQDIGEHFGFGQFSRERPRQIEARILRELRHPRCSRDLRGVYGY